MSAPETTPAERHMGEGLASALARLGSKIEAGEIAGGLTQSFNGKRYLVVSQEQYEHDARRSHADTPPPAAAGDREAAVSDLLSAAYRAGYREGCEDSGAEVDGVCLSDGVNQYVTDTILALRTPEPNSGGEVDHG